MKPLLAAILLSAVACQRGESYVQVSYQGTPALQPSAITIIVRQRDHETIYQGATLSPISGMVRAGVTPLSGREAEVAYKLATAEVTASDGTISLPARSDWSWGVDITIDSLNPTRFCFGCMGSQSFPLDARFRRNARDSVWVVWGGNSISNPVIY